MTTYSEAARPLDFLLSEAPGTLSRESITVVSGAGALAAGSVLGKVTASGKYDIYDASGNDGTETAVGILAYAVDATSADVSATLITRLAEVRYDSLGWGSNDANGKTAGLVDLAATFVIARS